MDELDPASRRGRPKREHWARRPENQLPGRVQSSEALPGAQFGPGRRPKDMEAEEHGDG